MTNNLYLKKIADTVKSNWILLLLFFVAAFIVLVFRFPFIHSSYGYDQSVYIYEGRALSLGEIPYRDVWDQRPLGIGYIFAFLYKIGFSSLAQFNIFEMFWIIFTLAVFAYVAKKIVRNGPVVGIGTIYLAFLLVNYVFMGGGNGSVGSTEGYVEIHLIMPLLLIILGTLMYGKKNNPVWLAVIGISAFAAFMIRATSLDFLAPPFVYLFFLVKEQRVRQWLKSYSRIVLRVILAFAIPLGAYMIYLAHLGVLADFYNAIVKFNVYYGSTIPDLKVTNAGIYVKALYSTVNLLQYLPNFPISYAVAMLGIVILFKKIDKLNLFILLFFVFSIINIAVGLKPWPHYFIQIYPFIALLLCFVIRSVYDNLKPFFEKYGYLNVPLLGIFLLFFVFPYQLKPFIVSLQKLQSDKTAFDSALRQSPPDPIVEYAKQHHWSGSRAVYWTNFGEYLETNMLSSTRYFSNALSDIWEMPSSFATPARVNEVLDDIKNKPPKIIVLNTNDFKYGSLTWSEGSPLRVYVESHFQIEPSLSNGTVLAFVEKQQ
ncbi:MAG: hypothetical protein PHP25_01135 [Candidatus Moranbacteria bacterium]|nr:hypothetical protein [Candidatus Moranbacteria bacterium]